MRERVVGPRASSVVMDEERLMAAARYQVMNPVRARLVDRAEDWPWSSARAHLAAKLREITEITEPTVTLYSIPIFFGFGPRRFGRGSRSVAAASRSRKARETERSPDRFGRAQSGERGGRARRLDSIDETPPPSARSEA
jgi:hypothetical protein